MKCLSQKAHELKNILVNGNHVRIVSHRNPDGDALGSMLAFAYICKFFNINYELLLTDPIPENLQFLFHTLEITYFDPENIDQIIANQQTDIIAFLDCGQFNRAGLLSDSILPHQKIINIDHHLSNPLFGHYNYIVDLSSTCEILYYLIQELNIPLSFELAEPLYVGILTDTGAFQYDKVTASTHEITAKLLDQGVSPFKIYHIIYQNYPIEWLNILQKALANMELYRNNSLAIIPFSLENTHNMNNQFDNTNILFPIICSTGSIQVCVFLKEKEDGSISASLRSKDDIDVAKIAQIFEGGGHKHAAGCRTNIHSLSEFKQMLLLEIQKHF